MKIKINGKYRFLIKLLLIAVPLISIALSFYTLPLEAAVSITIILTVLPFILDRFIFTYNILHIMPMPSDGMLSHTLGTSWFSNDTSTMEGLGFVILYKYKNIAKEAFNMLQAWNYGKTIDTSENITFRAVREGQGKYSIFVYPGERLESLQYSKDRAEELHGSNSHANISVTKFYMQFCFDYSDEELKKKCIEALPHVSELLINVGYVENGELKFYSKRGFRLRNFSLKDRSDSMLGEIEKRTSWEDPKGTLPEINQSLVDKVNQRLKEIA